jgi:hypothetical protein
MIVDRAAQFPPVADGAGRPPFPLLVRRSSSLT